MKIIQDEINRNDFCLKISEGSFLHCHENIISFLKDLRLYVCMESDVLPYYGINKGNRQIVKS